MPATFCHLCGKPVTARNRLFHHAAWPKGQKLRVCQDCLQDKPRCQMCTIPLAAVTTNGYCITCTQQERRCLTCGRRVTGQYWQINGQGPYCDQCRNERPACDLCCAPLGEDRWTLTDGRVFCGSCHGTGIFRLEDARALFDESKRVIAETLGMRLNIPTALVLVDRKQLMDVIHKQSDHSQHLDSEKTMGIYARRGMKRGIYVQTGLPRCLFLQVASHEYAHAWQGENCPLLTDVRFQEGFAEWVAYRVLSHYGYQDQMIQMRNGDNIYSQGLQFMLDLETNVGPKGVLDACRQSR